MSESRMWNRKSIACSDLLGEETDLFSREKPGSIWMVGGVSDFLNEDIRIEFAKLAERGDVQLFGDSSSPFCRSLPLALIDFTYYESGGGGILTFDPQDWKRACQTLAMHAAIRGIGRGVPLGIVSSQCEEVEKLTPPGRNKP